MRSYLYSFFILLGGFSFNASAQTTPADTSNYPYWAEMMQQSQVNFAQVQRAFEMYWQNRTIEKGSGWKPFKRWEYYWQNRLDSNGNLPPADAVWKNFFDVRDEINTNPFEQGSENDIFQYTGNAGNWKPLGPTFLPKNNTGQPNGLGRVNGIGFHPSDSNIIFIGAPSGGLWVTYNYGKTWESHTDSLPTLGVSSIAIDHVNPNTMYIGTGDRDGGDSYSYGVLKSFDAGKTWQISNTGMGSRTVGKLLIHPQFRDSLIAATNNGIYVSGNSGALWSKKSGTANFKDLVYNPANRSLVYAAEGGNFYRSTNGGNSWTKITAGLPGGQRGVIAVSAANPNYVYFLLSENSVFKGIYLSTNDGASFTTQSTSPNILGYEADGSGTTGQGWYDLCLAVDPNNENIVYAGGVNIFKSTNKGVTWTISGHWTGSGGGDAVHADQHVLEYSPVNEVLFVGNDGGIYFTNDGGNDWVDISSGIEIAQIYRMGQSTQKRHLYINGYQDNGTAFYDGEWKTIGGGDGMDCLVDYSDPTVMVGSIYYGSFTRYKNGQSEGTFAKEGSRGITEEGAWVTPIIQHNTNPNIFFAGYKNLWRTKNGLTEKVADISWDKISNNLGSSNNSDISYLEQSIVNSDILYISRSDKKLFRSDNVNDSIPTWIDLTANLPVSTGTPNCVETSPYNVNRVYMGLNRKVYRSDNKGLNWTDITANIPNLNINSIVIDTSTNTEDIYVGTDVGVYYKNISSTSWTYFNAGLPLSVNANDLKIFYNPRNPSNSKLRTATYGRGTWESDLYTDGTKKPIVDFTADATDVCLGSVVNFEDNTGYIPTQFKWVFSPSTVSYVNNTSDTVQNPSVRFNAKGSYTVSLIAKNANGADTLVQSNMIYVYDTAKRMCTTTTTGNTGFGIGISNVKVANLDNSSQGFDQNGSYEDYSCGTIVQLQRDSSYLLEVKTGFYNDEFVKVFIDYNDDGDFKDPFENVFTGTKQRTNHSTTFTVPNHTKANKLLRMRVISDFNTIGSPDCPTLTNGQSEDYNVYVSSPQAQLSISADSICVAQTTTIAAIVDGKANSIVWDFGADATPAAATGQGPFSVSYATAGYRTITTTINGSVITKTDSALWIGYAPQASFSKVDTLLCVKNATVNFTNISTITTGTLNYTWTFGDGNSSMAVHPNHSYLSASSYAVWLKAVSDIGCADSALQNITAIDSKIAATFTKGSGKQCLSGNSFSFTNTTTGSGNTFIWNFGDGTTSNQNGTVTHSYTTSGIKTVQLKAQSPKGCFDSTSQTIEVLAQPLASFVLPTKVCQDSAAMFVNSSTIPSGASAVYTWTFGDGNSSSVTSPSHTYTTAGLFNVTLKVTTNNSCEHDSTQVVRVGAKPSAAFSKTYLGNGNTKFTPLVSSMAVYNWTFGDGISTSGFSPTHQYLTKGAYTVSLFVEENDGCNNNATDTVNIPTSVGIDEITQNNIGLQALPNPFGNSIEISFTLKKAQAVNVYLTDILGRKVAEIWNAPTTSTQMNLAADTKTLSQGVYFIIIETEGEKVSLKMVK